MPISELLYFENNALLIDEQIINEILNLPAISNEGRYTPNVSKREADKLKTLAMHQDWKDAYLNFLKTHPNKSDTWYSQQIAKLPSANKRSSETIRRNMK